MDKKLVTTRELCDYYRLSRMTIERYRKFHGLPYMIIGSRTIRFDLEEVENWMKNNKFKKEVH